MARYRILNAVSQSMFDVFTTNTAAAGLPAPTSTDIYVLNSDGTVSHIVGTGLTLSGGVATGGTITSITRTSDVAGTVTFEIADQTVAANNSLVSFWNAANNAARLAYATSLGDSGYGSIGADIFSLGNGDDVLVGYQGADNLDGGNGFDFADYLAEMSTTYPGTGAAITPGTQGVIVNLSSASVTTAVTGGTFTVAAGTAKDSFGFTDTLTSIEGVNGTSFDDAFYGTGSDNTFRGYAGNDFIFGGAGFDELSAMSSGASGVFLPTTGMTVTYTTGSNFDGIVNADGFGSIDTFASIERIRGTQLADTFNGNDANNSFRGLAGNDTFNGGAGFDELDYRQDVNYGGASGVTVNLATGVATDGFGNTDILSGIERVIGTTSADTITGNAADNDIIGGSGADSLVGGDGFDYFEPGSGADTINGSPGTHPDMSYDDRDTVAYSDGSNGVGVIVNLSNAAITQTIGAGTFTVAATSARDWSGSTDTLIDIERVRGTNQADYLRGSDTANLREELLMGLAGNDTLNGGQGNNVAQYDRDSNFGGTSGVIVNLSAAAVTATIAAGTFTVASNTARDGFGATDTLINMDGARGTFGNDVFVGNEMRNTFRIQGGNDTIDGAGGVDSVAMFVADDFPALGATVNLALGTATALNGGVSTLTNIEDATGSTGADTLTGDAGDNLLDGYYGNDTIDGGDGFDIIEGGAGNNVLNGGAGNADVLSYLYDPALAQNYNLLYPTQQPLTNAGVTVNLLTGTATNWAGGTDTVSNFEAVVGTFFADTITGNASANTFRGLAGNDTIDGGAGTDTISYNRWDFDGRVGVPLPLINFSNPNGVIVNLGPTATTATISAGTFTVQAGQAYDGEGGTDTLSNIEDVEGSEGADWIVGSGGNNAIDGGIGADTIDGGAGNDTLFGGAGADNLFGGEGDDQFIFDAADNLAQVQGGAGFDTLVLTSLSLPTSFNLAAQGFERAEQRLIDTAGTETWSSQQNLYNAQWVWDKQYLTFDNGTSSYTELDDLGVELWSSVVNQNDANGQWDWQLINNDDGTSNFTELDQSGNQTWSNVSNQNDVNGLWDWQLIYSDDGTTNFTDLDQLGNQTWTQVSNQNTAAGLWDWQLIYNDNGTTNFTDLDQLGNQTWTQVSNQNTAAGLWDWQLIYNDDGTSNFTDLDHLGNQSWSSISNQNTAAGLWDWQLIYNDNGTTQYADLDQANANPWTQDVYLNSSTGTLLSHFWVMDDGSIVNF